MMIFVNSRIAQLGERQTEDLKVTCSIHVSGICFFVYLFSVLSSFLHFCAPFFFFFMMIHKDHQKPGEKKPKNWFSCKRNKINNTVLD